MWDPSWEGPKRTNCKNVLKGWFDKHSETQFARRRRNEKQEMFFKNHSHFFIT